MNGPPDGVLVGNGSNEPDPGHARGHGGGGDHRGEPGPHLHPVTGLLTEVFGGRHLGVPLTADFAFDLPALIRAAAAAQARVIVVNSPTIPPARRSRGGVAQLLEETEALVVVDEAYQDFGAPARSRCSPRTRGSSSCARFSKAMFARRPAVRIRARASRRRARDHQGQAAV